MTRAIGSVEPIAERTAEIAQAGAASGLGSSRKQSTRVQAIANRVQTNVRGRGVVRSFAVWCFMSVVSGKVSNGQRTERCAHPITG